MAQLPAALGNSGPAYTLVWNGRTYSAWLIDQARKVKFAKELYRRNREAARETAADDGDEAGLSAVLAELSKQHVRGQFAFLSPDGVAWQKTDAGALYLVQLVFDLSEDDALDLVTGNPTETVQLIRDVLQDSFKNVTFPEVKDLPNEGKVDGVGGASGENPDPNVASLLSASTTT